MQENNLIVLMYAMNNCYVQAVDIADAKKSGLEIDVEKARWSYREWKNIPIGGKRTLYDMHDMPSREGIIGVYDRTSTKQLSSMVHHAGEAVDHGNAIDVDAL